MERVEDPMNRLKGVGKAVLESEEGKEVVRAHAVNPTPNEEKKTALKQTS